MTETTKLNPSVLDTQVDKPQLSEQERKEGVNMGYVTGYMLTITIGMF